MFTIILLWVGAYYVLNGALTTGELMSFYAVIGYFTGPVSNLIDANREYQDAMIAADRLFEIMDLEEEKEGKHIQLKPDLLGDIQFKNVKFRYGSRAAVFENLNLTIPQGKVTAFIGESGSGKTTIVNILQKLYPLDEGRVLIGDINLDYISDNSLREMISIVPQEIYLFAGNVIENIAIGDFKPNMEKIITICKNLGIMEFIENLPGGFETYLGENGATLSGGQKQRLAIARALYKEPEILILDEATSSLDSSSEQYVQRTIELLTEQRKTVILIAHRLATICKADKIFVLHEGKLMEEGSHSELMKQEGEYFNYWQKQVPMLDAKAFQEFNGQDQPV